MSVDLGAYFTRVGYDGPRKPTLDTLRALHRLHPQAIAFENLTPLLGEPVPLDAPSLHAKMVRDGRGGYCFEHNLLFASVLEALGFKFRVLTGWPRLGTSPDNPRPRTHVLLLVEADGAEWIVDVGFGGNTITAPLNLKSREPQDTPHEPARLIETEIGLAVQSKIAGEWQTLVEFDLDKQAFAELEMGNWFTSTHPKSRFVNGLMAARVEPGKRYGMLDNQFVTHNVGGKSERRALKSAAEMRETLANVFKIKLPATPKLDDVFTRLTKGAA